MQFVRCFFMRSYIARMAGATIMAITYGHQVTSADDEFVALAEAVREHAEKTPGSNLVDVIPLCEFLLQIILGCLLFFI